MKTTGIDTTRFKAHSFRSASSTKAVMVGVPIDNIKLHANWNLNNSTFEDYYYKPGNQHIRGAIIVDTVFGNVIKKVITSEAGLEATAIMVGTTHSSNVAEKMTGDVLFSPGIEGFSSLRPLYHGFLIQDACIERSRLKSV
ncbi:hypothetical protein RMCBS344292_07225 [Rhizopus microsporus]|nr:hypothetical protein RMCBS344292_07225 [Rhizopus microsporus]